MVWYGMVWYGMVWYGMGGNELIIRMVMGEDGWGWDACVRIGGEWWGEMEMDGDG